MATFNCENCRYRGEGINNKYFENGQLKSYMCPVCYTKMVLDKNDPHIEYVQCSEKDTALSWSVGVLSLMFAFGSIGGFFLSGHIYMLLIAVFLSITGGCGVYTASSKEEWNRFIRLRISKYKETGIIPS